MNPSLADVAAACLLIVSTRPLWRRPAFRPAAPSGRHAAGRWRLPLDLRLLGALVSELAGWGRDEWREWRADRSRRGYRR